MSYCPLLAWTADWLISLQTQGLVSPRDIVTSWQGSLMALKTFTQIPPAVEGRWKRPWCSGAALIKRDGMYQAGVKDEHVTRPLWEPICSNQLLRLLATRGENGTISRAGDSNSESRAEPAEHVKRVKPVFQGSGHTKPLLESLVEIPFCSIYLLESTLHRREFDFSVNEWASPVGWQRSWPGEDILYLIKCIENGVHVFHVFIR